MDEAILYIGSASYEAPATGLDNVVRTHLAELSRGRRQVIAVIVSPTIAQYRLFEIGKCHIHVYPNILHSSKSRLRIIMEKFRIAFMTPHSIHAISLYSPAARSHIKALLTSNRLGVVIVDYIYSLVNIPAYAMRGGRHKIIYISHDLVTKEALRTHWQYKRARWRAALLALQLLKSRANAGRALRHADMTVFLSEYDRTLCKEKTRESIALLPFSEPQAAQLSEDGREHNNTLLFVGSPDFEPNAFAINWLVEKLAPRLMQHDSTIRIVLVGKDAARYIHPHTTNVQAAGFVTGEAMQAMLRSCIALICPIVHGSGVKIKILDALAQHCPIIATPEALRGYEYFSIAPEVFMDDPERTVRSIVALARQPELREKTRQRLAERMQDYLRFRSGKLVTIAEEVATHSNNRRSDAIT